MESKELLLENTKKRLVFIGLRDLSNDIGIYTKISKVREIISRINEFKYYKFRDIESFRIEEFAIYKSLDQLSYGHLCKIYEILQLNKEINHLESLLKAKNQEIKNLDSRIIELGNKLNDANKADERVSDESIRFILQESNSLSLKQVLEEIINNFQANCKNKRFRVGFDKNSSSFKNSFEGRLDHLQKSINDFFNS